MTTLTEADLAEFRRDHLSAPAILRAVTEHIMILYRIGIGVGKSHAADGLLLFPGTYERFDLVIYAAPTWGIINERAIVAGRDTAPVPWTKLIPRPKKRCGTVDQEWGELEARGCAAYAKATLCKSCPALVNKTDPCLWPHQFQRLNGIRLLFCPEQQLVLNRSLLTLLRERTSAERVLVVLDEGRLLDANLEVTIEPADLERFRNAVQHVTRPHAIPSAVGNRWTRAIEALLRAGDGVVQGRYRFPPTLNRQAFKIQRAGIAHDGPAFRYLGRDLVNFQWAKLGERWKDDEGRLHFVSRPYFGCHVLLLSAHMDGTYAGHRLGRGPIQSPFEEVRLRHTGSRILNLKNRAGADKYFGRNKDQVLDTIAVLVRRNIHAGRTTLLISRKKSKGICAAYLQERLAGWGMKVRFVTEAYHLLPSAPDPPVIPIIHFGVLGVNHFCDYETAYCMNSFYVPSGELNRRLQESEPEKFRVELIITSGHDMTRRVEIATRGVPDVDHTFLGTVLLRKLELDPVIQAAGRVRFLTKPREILFFQMNDLHRDVGEYEEVGSLQELRHALGVPEAKEIDRAYQIDRILTLQAEGLEADEIASHLGISRRTVFRRLAASASAKNTKNESRREFGTQESNRVPKEVAP